MTPTSSSGKKEQALRASARALFSQKGFKDTTISDITDRAGMAVGTFYLYFNSKDQLFMNIFLEENTRLKKRIMESINPQGRPMQVMQEMMGMNQQGMRDNPILRHWYDRELFEKIEKKYRQEQGLDQLNFLYSSFTNLIEGWQAAGKMRSDMDSGMIMALFTAIILLDLHKGEIGPEYFPEIQWHLATFVMEGLMEGCPSDPGAE